MALVSYLLVGHPKKPSQIAALTTQVQDNAKRFKSLEEQNVAVRVENQSFQEKIQQLSTLKPTCLNNMVPTQIFLLKSLNITK